MTEFEQNDPPTETGPEPIRAILAVNSGGIVTRANMPARRLFADEDVLAGRSLGGLLARTLAQQSTTREQVVVSLQTPKGPSRFVVVLGEDHRPDLEEEAKIPVAPDSRSHVAAVGDYIAHELRNNLAIILGLAQLMKSRADSRLRAEEKAALDGIESETEHAQQVVTGLLKLAEARTKDRDKVVAVPLHSLVFSVISDHGRRYPQRRIEVQGDAPVFANASATWLKIALGNLLSNAEKVTPADQPIRILLTAEAGRGAILVLDEGERLTQEFYRALWNIYEEGPPTGLTITGSGIGLSLCKELVEAMGGRVWAGPRPAGGSAFSISLPGPDLIGTPEGPTSI